MTGIQKIFIPEEDYITNRWNAIRSRFSFADSISETVDIIFTFFKETAFDEPPKIHIDLSYAESKYDYGGETYCLDMSWYERYKPTVDAFLSAFMWACFIWRLYVALPNIINGVGVGGDVFNNLNSNAEYVKWSLKGGKK